MKILLVDDDKMERAALRELIQGHPGMEIVEADDGQTALDLLCDGLKPEVCFFDLRMPRMDGVELLQRVRRDPLLRGLKVVVTSSAKDRETIVTLAKLQISGYLLKPYDAAKTQAVVRPLFATTATLPQLASRNLLARTALVVDGDEIARLSAEGLIKAGPERWETYSARNGAEALTMLRRGLRPDLTLIDLNMPEMDGAELIRLIREDPLLRSLRLAIISASTNREVIPVLAALGVRQYLTKPVDQAKVAELLADAPASPESKKSAP